MAARRLRPALSLVARSDQPLIGVASQENGKEVTEYFVEEELAEPARTPQAIQEALSLAGAWSDLDWEEAHRELDRIRHQSRPTPPIDRL